MINPASPNQDPNSYFDLQRRVFKRIQSEQIEDHIREILHKAYEEAILAEGTSLTRTEHKRLQAQVSKLVLEAMLQTL